MSKYILNYISKFKNMFINKTIPKPLGRWSHNNHSLKADYANMDSCGDVLCGKPDYFKNLKEKKK